MPNRLSLHAPALVNTIGHAAGTLIFGLLLYLFFVDWRRNPSGRRVLPTVAAALAFLWNLGSLVGLAAEPRSGLGPELIIALSFSVLSFLPAVLLQISAENSPRLIVAGYVLSAAAASLHVAELADGTPRLHYAAVLLITVGFGVLTSVVVVRGFGGPRSGASRRLAASMMLFLFAISFVHFGPNHGDSNHGGGGWSGEIALHHAGIPLSLFVLLQDYRFLLLDTFIRFLVNALLAAATVSAVVLVGVHFASLTGVEARPFYAGLEFVAACLLLIAFGAGRQRVQALVTRVVFMRANPDDAMARLQQVAAAQPEESAFLMAAAETIADFFACVRFGWADQTSGGWALLTRSVHFSRGDHQVLRLGPRRGGRLFLSEDLSALDRLLLETARQVDRLRSSEMQALVAKGELQALQAQINPHFLFNTLNTIYGSIPRTAQDARSLILNLSDILRYSLSTERALIPIEDEVKIVTAYLAIEQARLGPRLQTKIEVDPLASAAEIPAFSIQPLVENAITHGAGAQAGTGYVKLAIATKNERVQVEISNSGAFDHSSKRAGHGMALNNVRRRLAICYGDDANFTISSDSESTVVRFNVPVHAATEGSSVRLR